MRDVLVDYLNFPNDMCEKDDGIEGHPWIWDYNFTKMPVCLVVGFSYSMLRSMSAEIGDDVYTGKMFFRQVIREMRKLTEN